MRGTLPHTLLDTGAGDDVVFVSDAADLGSLPAALPLAGRDLEALHEAVLHGTVTYDDLTFHGSLDEIDGDLDIDAGAGSNTLAVSDHADSDADTGFVIDDHSITGLADGAMTYTATGGDLAGQGDWTRLHDAGMFGRGITIHLGTGSDNGTIDSVRGGAIASSPFGATVTTVYANQGADDITVDAPDIAAALLVVHGDDGDDTIDAATSSLPVVVFGDAGSDTITGGSGNDQLFGDDGTRPLCEAAGRCGLRRRLRRRSGRQPPARRARRRVPHGRTCCSRATRRSAAATRSTPDPATTSCSAVGAATPSTATAATT